MTDDRLSPLPGDVRAMIDADRRSGGMPDDARRRVLKRMGAGFLAAGVATAAMGSGTAAAATGTIGGFFARKSALVLTAFLFGTAAGAGGYAIATRTTKAPTTTPSTKAMVATSAPAPTMTALPVVTQAAPAETIAPTATSAPVVAVVHPAVAPSTTESAGKSRDEELAAERLLVEMARSSLAHGQSSQALDAVAKHAAKYPGGQLVEERESIAIHALIGAGRSAEARTRADGFRKRFPKSLFLPAIDAALGPEP